MNEWVDVWMSGWEAGRVGGCVGGWVDGLFYTRQQALLTRASITHSLWLYLVLYDKDSFLPQ